MVVDLPRIVFPAAVVFAAWLLSFPLGSALFRIFELQLHPGRDAALATSGNARALGPDRRRGGRIDARSMRLFFSFADLPPQSPRSYLASLFGVAATALVAATFLLQFQYLLPWNPDARAPLDASVALHAAVSALTGAGNPHVRGTEELSHLALLVTGGWLRLLSAALGLSVVAALARLLAGAPHAGNLFGDLARALFRFLLPASLGLGLALVALGVPMTFAGQRFGFSLDGATQQIALGPVAFIVAARTLSVSGGGFYLAGASHPFETPSLAAALLLMVISLALPLAILRMFGRALGALRQKRVWIGVGFVFVLLQGALQLGFARDAFPILAHAERGLPFTDALLEGTELRFSAWVGDAWNAVSAVTGAGGALSSLDSAHPLGTFGALLGMWGFPGFAGSGSGVLRLFLYTVLTAYLAGTMTGRTSSWHGFRLEARELRYAVLGLLAPFLCVLVGTAVFSNTYMGRSTVSELGHHGLSQLMVEFSAAAFQGSLTMEGLLDNTTAWNLAVSAVALLCRFGTIAACFGLVTTLTARPKLGNPRMLVRTDNWRFGILLLLVIAGSAVLFAFPLAALGPVGETLELMQGGTR